jgi:predicted GIY-YIG superfamily endonuclease
MFYVYMLRCSDGSYYIGHTDNLEARVVAHHQGIIPGYTFGRRPVELVWSEMLHTRDEAFALERQIKGWSRRKKEALIRGDWAALPVLARKRSNGRRQPAHPEPVEG